MPGLMKAQDACMTKLAAACLAIGLTAAGAPALAASGSVKCGERTYTASVPGGSCQTGGNWVKCTGSNGSDTANISCLNMPGPCTSNGGGSCKAERMVQGDAVPDRGKLKLKEGLVPAKPALQAK